jgi:hypothetical protein
MQELLIAQVGEGNPEKDHGTLGQSISEFSDQVMEEKSDLAQKIEAEGSHIESNRGIASETTPTEHAIAAESSPYLLYGLIVLLFAFMIFLGVKYSKHQKK